MFEKTRNSLHTKFVIWQMLHETLNVQKQFEHDMTDYYKWCWLSSHEVINISGESQIIRRFEILFFK